MKASGILAAVASATVIGLSLTSCDPVEPSTYSEQMFRVGTVQYSDGKASIISDVFNETFGNITNFKTESDMDRFSLKHGDRLFAAIKFYAEGSMSNYTLTLSAAKSINVDSLETVRPSSVLNNYFELKKFNLYTTVYPAIWTSGHLVNIAPTYYVPEQHRSPKFHLDLVDFQNDTLFTRLYSDNPDCDVSLNPSYTQSLLCFDISSLRQTSTDPANSILRDSILSRMERMQTDSFTITVMTPDTMRARNTKNIQDTVYLQPVPGLSQSVKMKFDF